MVATQIFFIFIPKLGEGFQFDGSHIFQKGWFNHQLGILYHPKIRTASISTAGSPAADSIPSVSSVAVLKVSGGGTSPRGWVKPQEFLGVLFQSCLWLGTIDVNNHTNTVNLNFFRGYKFYQTYFLRLQTFSFSRFFFGVFKGVRNMYHQKSELNPSGEIGPGSSGFPYHRWDWYTYVDPYLEDPCMVYIYLYI